MSALHAPAVTAKPFTALNTTPCNENQNSSTPQVLPATPVVVAFVRMQFPWTLAWLPSQALDCRGGIYSSLKQHRGCLLAPLTKTTNGIPWASTTMCRLEPSLPLSVGFGPDSSPPGAWYCGAITTRSAPINLVMLTQAHQHGLMQLLPDASLIPFTKSAPACHATAIA